MRESAGYSKRSSISFCNEKDDEGQASSSRTDCIIPTEQNHQCSIHSGDEDVEFSESIEHSIDRESADGFKQLQRKRENNRLQSRLEELERDVSQLTLKLRGSACEIESEAGFTQQNPRKVLIKVGSPMPETRTTSKYGTLSRIHNGERVSRTRNPNRISDISQLDIRQRKQVKMRFAESEKKLKKLTQYKEACSSLKKHCSVLQESLELSERIRVRQKSLLQKLQSKEAKEKNESSKSIQTDQSKNQSVSSPESGGTTEQEATDESSRKADRDASEVKISVGKDDLVRGVRKSARVRNSLNRSSTLFERKPPERIHITESSEEVADMRVNIDKNADPNARKKNVSRSHLAHKQRFLEPTKASLQHRATSRITRKRIPFRV
uniref:AlNc14C1G140 protein n=1 Tax=Albugo laibachii Nc14 TaxID=890382 RepID=F0VYZ3_9STRA|nr:AlNc14C1G140 [Albugo laibachii Nc14]|eukprot:CCA14008.1 AlNc14C1G140 [Albugo laibachii Nc14]